MLLLRDKYEYGSVSGSKQGSTKYFRSDEVSNTSNKYEVNKYMNTSSTYGVEQSRYLLYLG